jgi:hypothetical protein
MLKIFQNNKDLTTKERCHTYRYIDYQGKPINVYFTPFFNVSTNSGERIDTYFSLYFSLANSIVTNSHILIDKCKEVLDCYYLGSSNASFGEFDLDIFRSAIPLKYEGKYSWFITWFVKTHYNNAPNDFIFTILSFALSEFNFAGIEEALSILKSREFDIAGFLNTLQDGKTVLDRLVTCYNGLLRPSDPIDREYVEINFSNICNLLIKNGAVATNTNSIQPNSPSPFTHPTQFTHPAQLTNPAQQHKKSACLIL